MSSAHGSRKVIFAAMAGNGLIAITKFIAAGITGSSAMFSEAIHSVVDTGNQILMLYGMKRAQKPADAGHPFGYSMELYFWTFVVAILIFSPWGRACPFMKESASCSIPTRCRNPW